MQGYVVGVILVFGEGVCVSIHGPPSPPMVHDIDYDKLFSGPVVWVWWFNEEF